MENREIKFRVWDFFRRVMVYPKNGYAPVAYFGLGEDLQPSRLADKHILQQYTGLKDRNKNYVYEGDLLQHYIDKRLFIWEVQYRNGVFGIVNINGEHRGGFNPLDGSEYYFTDREIIGNIYETPELLQTN